MPLSNYLSVLAAVALALIGLLVIRGNPKAPINRLFAAGMVALACGDASRFLLGVGSTSVWLLFWQRIGLATDVIALWVWYVFALGFGSTDFVQALRRQRPIALGIAITSVVFLGLIPTNLVIGRIVVGHDGWISFPLGWAGWGLLIASLAIAMVVLWNMEMTFRFADAENRWKIKFLVLGLFSILGFYIFWLSRTVLHGTIFTDGWGVRAVVHLAAAVLIGFSLLRHRLLDVDVFVSRYVVYRSLTLAVVGAYLLLLGLAQEVAHILGLRPGAWVPAGILMLTGLVLAALLLSENLRRRLKIFVDTHFYKNKYDYRKEWLSLTNRLARAITVDEVIPRIAQGLRETMWVHKAGIYLLEPGGTRFRLASGEGFGQDEQALDVKPAFLRWLSRNSEPFDVDRVRSMPVEGDSRDLVDVLSRRALRIVAPMVVRNDVLGLLVVGPELSGQAFRPDDYDLCRAVAAQAAAVIMTARLAEDLAEGREIRAFAEMASFLIHDIKNCVHTLSLIAANAENNIGNPAFQQDMIRAIRSSVEKMQGLLRRVAGLRVRAVRLERVNFNDLVRAALEVVAEAVPDTVRVETSGELTVSLIGDSEQLEGVIRNLTMNAIEAVGKEGCITIQIFQDREEAVLVVTDNGRGMSPEFMSQSLFRPFRSTKGGLGLGLYQCRRVVEAHGGWLEVQSVEGRGTTCTLRLPIDGAGKGPKGADESVVLEHTIS